MPRTNVRPLKVAPTSAAAAASRSSFSPPAPHITNAEHEHDQKGQKRDPGGRNVHVQDFLQVPHVTIRGEVRTAYACAASRRRTRRRRKSSRRAIEERSWCRRIHSCETPHAFNDVSNASNVAPTKIMSYAISNRIQAPASCMRSPVRAPSMQRSPRAALGPALERGARGGAPSRARVRLDIAA